MNKIIFIPVSQGILTKQHRDKIGTSIWEFLWLLDKVTLIKDDEGIVWGGKPVKLHEIADQMGTSRLNVSRNLHKLEAQKYITTLRTPFGMVIKVKKAKKIFYKSNGNDTSLKTESNENDTSRNAFDTSSNGNDSYKEDIKDDIKVDIKEREQTPAEETEKFFSMVLEDSNDFEVFIQRLHEQTSAPPDALRRIVRAFVGYWTEPNSTGKKLRWQLQGTFEVKRRLVTWLSRERVNNKPKGKAII